MYVFSLYLVFLVSILKAINGYFATLCEKYKHMVNYMENSQYLQLSLNLELDQSGSKPQYY